MNTFLTTSLLCARSNGNTSLLTKVIAWRTLRASLLRPSASSISQHIESYWREPRFKIILQSFGRCLISFFPRFSAHARNLRSGLTNLCLRCIHLPTNSFRKMTRRFLSSLRKSSFWLLIGFIKSFALFCWGESKVRLRKSFLQSQRWWSRLNYQIGKSLCTTV